MTSTEVIVLAGGKGVRMRSGAPKSLQRIGGRPMLAHLMQNIRDAGISQVHVVHANNADQLRQHIGEFDVNWVVQSEPLGTAHAVSKALPAVAPGSIAVVLYGDNPFVGSKTIANLIESASAERLALLTSNLDNPDGFGRIIRNTDGDVVAIVEQRDASASQLNVREVNAGPLAAPARMLARWIKRIDRNNDQGEYYLTDVAKFALDEGVAIATCQPESEIEVKGVNSRIEQANLERMYQYENALKLMGAGVAIVDPSRFDLRGSCVAGSDCRIDINVVLEGEIALGDNVRIGPNCVIRNTTISSNAVIEANCVIDGAHINEGAVVGPFARIRPGTKIGKNCKIGNFVEINRSELGSSAKAGHLAYVGDSQVGDDVNVGAGVITCNYDGKKKHQTVIGDRAFIGSNASLVAPVEVGEDSIIGAGSTISKSVEPGHLAVERAKTRTFPNRRFRGKSKIKQNN